MKFTLPKMPDLSQLSRLAQMKGLMPPLPKMPSLSELTAKLPEGIAKSLKIDLKLSEASRYMSGPMMERALAAFDKSTLLIISVAWLAAVVAMGVSFLSVREVGILKVKVETARAQEPVLPKVERVALKKDQYTPLLERLKKQFPTLQYDVTSQPTLRIYSNNGEDFITWLNAVSYTDSMVSTVRWTMATFCVGSECPGDTMMQAELTAESINITQPEGRS